MSQKRESICQYSCQESHIWHEASLGILIKTHEEPIRGTLCGPWLDHERAMIMKYHGKGPQDILSRMNPYYIFHMTA